MESAKYKMFNNNWEFIAKYLARVKRKLYYRFAGHAMLAEEENRFEVVKQKKAHRYN